MEVNIKQALKVFFANSSFDMIYFEAIANALDAGATDIDIEICLEDKQKIQGLSLTIKDNGEGFTHERFEKFGRLFDVDETNHKGLGRLVYLCYFHNVRIESVFEGVHKRTFDFSEDFGNRFEIKEIDESPNGSIFTMTGFAGQKIGKWDYISPDYLIKIILEKFYMRLYKARLNATNINIRIRSIIVSEQTSKEASFCSSGLPELKEKNLPNTQLFSTGGK